MKEKMRFAGVDLAKTIAILFVIVHHISDCGISLTDATFTLTWLHTFIHSISYSCIDLFALATGYLCVTSKCKYSRLLSLWMATVFWGIVMLGACQFIGEYVFSPKMYIKAALPILFSQYWFFTSYFMLFICMPTINKGVTSLNRRECKQLLIALFVFICGYSCSGYGGDRFHIHGGYSFLWLAIVYVFGAYIRLYWKPTHRAHWYFVAAIGIAFLCCVRQLISAIIGFRIPGDRFNLISYVSPFTFAVGGLIFLGCLRLQLKNVKLCSIFKHFSVCTFGMYLIHVQPYVWGIWRSEWHKVQVSDCWTLVAVILGGSVAFFVVLCLIELARIKLFSFMGIEKQLSKFDTVLPRT